MILILAEPKGKTISNNYAGKRLLLVSWGVAFLFNDFKLSSIYGMTPEDLLIIEPTFFVNYVQRRADQHCLSVFPILLVVIWKVNTYLRVGTDPGAQAKQNHTVGSFECGSFFDPFPQRIAREHGGKQTISCESVGR